MSRFQGLYYVSLDGFYDFKQYSNVYCDKIQKYILKIFLLALGSI